MREAFIKKFIEPIYKNSNLHHNSKQLVKGTGVYSEGFIEPVTFHQFGVRTKESITQSTAIIEFSNGRVTEVPLSHISFKKSEL